MTNAEKALEYLVDGMTVGLGSGHAAERFIQALGRRVRAGFTICGVPTSKRSSALAAELQIPLLGLDQADSIDVAVDGADEVDPNLDLIKGYGHALAREKIVAAAAKRLIILVGPEDVAEKLVPVLGSRGKLPVEVVPFGLPFCQRRLAELGYPSQLVHSDGKPLVTDNGNHILECRVGAVRDPALLEQELRAVPGVVITGLFLGMADIVLVEDGGRVDVRSRPNLESQP